MKLFHSTYDEYYDAGVGEFPLPIRCVRNVAIAIVWAFALCMWRARMEDERYMLERSDGKAPRALPMGRGPGGLAHVRASRPAPRRASREVLDRACTCY